MTVIKKRPLGQKMNEKLGSQNCSCCKMHERVLCGKITRLEKVLRRFLSIAIDSVNEDVPYGTEILWSSRHNLLKSFCDLVSEIVIFLEIQRQGTNNIKSMNWQRDVTFFVSCALEGSGFQTCQVQHILPSPEPSILAVGPT